MSAAVGCLGSATVSVSEVTSNGGLRGTSRGMMPTTALPLLTEAIFCFRSLWCLWLLTLPPPAERGRGRPEDPLEDPAEAR